jgi:hypothetical protein
MNGTTLLEPRLRMYVVAVLFLPLQTFLEFKCTAVMIKSPAILYLFLGILDVEYSTMHSSIVLEGAGDLQEDSRQ